MIVFAEISLDDVTNGELIQELRGRGFEVREKGVDAIMERLTREYNVPAWLTDALRLYLNEELNLAQFMAWREATERALQ